ncbi:MAG TPA: LemA family protein [Myxococcota bacterium]|jgi:LemA protein|nr:LemA family protein [Myxococcota bacterium]
MTTVRTLDDLLENAAYRLAAGRDGCVSPLELATVAPATVDDAVRVLDRMVDRVDVRREDQGRCTVYRIPAAPAAGARGGCLGCGLPVRGGEVCDACEAAMATELARSGRDAGWRARVSEEHALLRAAGARGGGELTAATLAGESAVDSVHARALLDRWGGQGFVAVELASSEAPLRYVFPAMSYPPARWAWVQERLRLAAPAPLPWKKAAVPAAAAAAALVVLWGLGFVAYGARFASMRAGVDSAAAQLDNVEARRGEVVKELATVLAASAGSDAAALRDAARAAADGNADMATLLAAVSDARAKGLVGDRTVVALMDEVAGSENRVRVERKRYNDAATAVRASASAFPGALYWHGDLPALR